MVPLSWKVPAHRLVSQLPGEWRLLSGKNATYFYSLFPWALETAKRRYMGMGSIFN